MRTKADIVICGAGIAGAAAAYHLGVRRDVGSITLVREDGKPSHYLLEATGR